MNMRLYPDFVPPFLNEPSAENFKIVTNAENGEGLVALVPFRAGEVVFSFTGIFLTEQTLHTLQFLPGHYVHDPFVMGKVLHSCEPNMACDMETRTFTALRDIKAGEYVTMDYETTEEVLFRPFHCGCASSRCRGLIRGHRFLSEEQQRELVRGLVSSAV
jgi:tyrocidine synthetase-3